MSNTSNTSNTQTYTAEMMFLMLYDIYVLIKPIGTNYSLSISGCYWCYSCYREDFLND